MKDQLFDSAKISAYFLWECLGYDNALNLWYCAEDIACFFEQSGILNPETVSNIKDLDKNDPGYIEFVRHLAFRIFIYTNQGHEPTNWYAAERLLNHREWTQNITNMAAIYHRDKANQSVMNEVRSENVRAFYDEQTFHKA